jgi:aryl-alcohol dehydrogenase-like predicted oxidoreductase
VSTLPIADVEVARIGLGTNRLTPKDVGFVREAVEAGLQLIDTAHVYTDGDSERAIGEAGVAGDGVVIATKGGYGDGHGRPDVLRDEIEQSFESLQTEVIDLYYLHRIDPGTPLEESLAVIGEFRDQGKIREVGISAVGIEEIERARQVLPIAAVQNHYNVDDRGHDDVVDHCAEQGIVFVPYYPLKGKSPAALTEIAQRRETTEEQIALAWLLHRSPAILPIPGTRSIEHLRENLAALEIELTQEELQALG